MDQPLKKDLRWMVFFCSCLGLLAILASIWCSVYWGQMKSQLDDDFVPQYIVEHDLAVIRLLMFGVVPLMGFCFLYFGYKLWTWSRK